MIRTTIITTTTITVISKHDMRFFHFYILFIVSVSLFVLSGCTSSKVCTSVEYRDRLIHTIDTVSISDTTLIHDSVSVFIKGDTVIRNSYRDRFIIRRINNTHIDTVRITDTLFIEKGSSKGTGIKSSKGIVIGSAIGFIIGLLFFLYLKCLFKK